MYSTILPRVTSSAILESTQERIWRNHHCLRSGGKQTHEYNLRIEHCLRSGESVHMRCDTLQNGRRLNSGEKNGWGIFFFFK